MHVGNKAIIEAAGPSSLCATTTSFDRKILYMLTPYRQVLTSETEQETRVVPEPCLQPPLCYPLKLQPKKGKVKKTSLTSARLSGATGKASNFFW
jgi:hypothetical protein